MDPITPTSFLHKHGTLIAVIVIFIVIIVVCIVFKSEPQEDGWNVEDAVNSFLEQQNAAKQRMAASQ